MSRFFFRFNIFTASCQRGIVAVSKAVEVPEANLYVASCLNLFHLAFCRVLFSRPTHATKFAAIKDVAEFVGSPLSDSELCCLATEGSKDMGSHTTSRKERGKITTRFGKWKVRYVGMRLDRCAGDGLLQDRRTYVC